MNGEKHWLQPASLFVKGDPNAKPWEGDPSVIQTWTKVVVLRVKPIWLPFRVGFISQFDPIPHFMVEETPNKDGIFRMRVGREDVTYLVLPLGACAIDRLEDFGLELIKRTSIYNTDFDPYPLS